MTIPARLRKTSDLVVYTKLTVLTALFILKNLKNV